MKTRIYITADKQGKGEQLVRATHGGQALRHAYAVRVATTTDVERLFLKGQRVQEAADTPEDHADDALAQV